MRESKQKAVCKKNSSAAAQIKRKYSKDIQQNDLELQSKKQKSVHRTKTLTLKPHDSLLNYPFVNRFQPILVSSSRSRKQKHNYSIAESNRKWVYSGDDIPAYIDRFVFVSYNILGVENASKHPDLYVKIPPELLEWDRRVELLYKEISHYNAGILCFQEVDRFDDLDSLFQKDGFKGLYKARTGEAYDGCAIFWKDRLFTLLQEENIEFQKFGLRDNVAQLCVLEMNESESDSDPCMLPLKANSNPSRRLVVGNVHVLFNPNRGDIKLGQVRIFLERAYKLSRRWGGIPVVLGGDLNSLPQSAIYQFLARSELDILVHDRRNISGQLEHSLQNKYFRYANENVNSRNISIPKQSMHFWSDEELRLATGSKGATHLHHQLKLSSAYIGVPGTRRSRDSRGEPLATSYHSKFMGTVDYIWHTEELLPVRVLETLPLNILRRSAALPNQEYGSDHLALVCELAFVDDGN